MRGPAMQRLGKTIRGIGRATRRLGRTWSVRGARRAFGRRGRRGHGQADEGRAGDASWQELPRCVPRVAGWYSTSHVAGQRPPGRAHPQLFSIARTARADMHPASCFSHHPPLPSKRFINVRSPARLIFSPSGPSQAIARISLASHALLVRRAHPAPSSFSPQATGPLSSLLLFSPSPIILRPSSCFSPPTHAPTRLKAERVRLPARVSPLQASILPLAQHKLASSCTAVLCSTRIGHRPIVLGTRVRTPR